MGKRSIFVTTGTSHYNFDRMLALVEQMLAHLSGEYEVLLQYGHSNDRSLPGLVKSVEFLSREEAENAYKNADLVFSHCGIGSIFNSLKYNRPTVIVPRYERYEEFSDDHQLQIATEIASNDMVFMVPDGELDLDGFAAFVAQHCQREKKEIDLTNYGLAEFIKTRLYAG